MEFTTPENFSDDINELVALLRQYDTSTDPAEKDRPLRSALATACRFLDSLDMNALSNRIDEIFRDVDAYEKLEIRTKTWFDAVFGEASHFHKFVEETEEVILKGAGIELENRKRILKKLRDLRHPAHTEAANLTTKPIISAIQNLKNDVCQLTGKNIEPGQQLNVRNKVQKAGLVGVIIADATASTVVPSAKPDDIAASVTLGAAALLHP